MSVAFHTSIRGGDQVLVADKLEVAIDDRQLVAPWSGILRRGDLVGLVGPNGAGKSTFLHTVLGLRPAASGSVRLMPSVEVAFYRQDLGDVNLEESLYDLIAHRRAMWTRGQIQGHLGRFGFSGDEVLRKAGTLSGGERARVALALMMLQDANLLVFDEPTNHLDVESIEALEDALDEYEGTVLLVSHDRALLTSLTTRIWAIENQRVQDYPGNFADWEVDSAKLREEEKASSRGRKAAEKSADRSPSRRREAAEMPAQSDAKRARANPEQLEARITALETELAAVEQQLADPSLYAGAGNRQESARLAAEQARLKAELEVAMAEWEEAVG